MIGIIARILLWLVRDRIAFIREEIDYMEHLWESMKDETLDEGARLAHFEEELAAVIYYR